MPTNTFKSITLTNGERWACNARGEGVFYSAEPGADWKQLAGTGQTPHFTSPQQFSRYVHKHYMNDNGEQLPRMRPGKSWGWEAPEVVVFGTGTIDGHDEDDDLRLLVASIDKRAIDGLDPGAPFWDAMARRDPLLRRTAAKWNMEVSEPGDPLPPKTVRICASFLLSD